MILLDTSFLVGALLRDSPADLLLRSWLAEGEPLAISAIAWAEFLCGPVGDDQVALATRVVPEQVPFLPEDAPVAARLFNETGRRRGTLADCMIAAGALRLEAPVATANLADFRRFSPAGLRLVES